MGFLVIQELFAGQLLPALLMLQEKEIIASGAAVCPLAVHSALFLRSRHRVKKYFSRTRCVWLTCTIRLKVVKMVNFTTEKKKYFKNFTKQC